MFCTLECVFFQKEYIGHMLKVWDLETRRRSGN